MGGAEMGAGHAGHPDHADFGGDADVDHAANGFNPTEILRDFDYGKTTRGSPAGGSCASGSSSPRTRRSRSRRASGIPAWTYNGRVPGPTLRCREGERLRIRFVNGSAHPHTMHFHGIHPAAMDGVPGIGAAGVDRTGRASIYEFDAEPFGLHLYHCHVGPLAEHIATRPVRRVHHRPAGRGGPRPTRW